jgi:hypothetical protein
LKSGNNCHDGEPKHNDNYVEEDGNYLFAETIEEKGLRLGTKEIEMIKKIIGKNKGQTNGADELGISELCTEK